MQPQPKKLQEIFHHPSHVSSHWSTYQFSPASLSEWGVARRCLPVNRWSHLERSKLAWWKQPSLGKQCGIQGFNKKFGSINRKYFFDVWVQTIGKSAWASTILGYITCSMGNTSSFRVHFKKQLERRWNQQPKILGNSLSFWGPASRLGLNNLL